MRLIDEQELPGSSQHEDIQMTSIHTLTQSNEPDTLDTSPISPAPMSNNATARIGKRVIIILVLMLLLEVAVFGFLAFLWFSSRTNYFWHWTASKGYVASAVTASSFIIRVAVDLQAGVAVAMLAALLLESDSPILLTDTAQMSKLRAGSAIPLDLLFPYMRSLHSRRCKTGRTTMYVLLS